MNSRIVATVLTLLCVLLAAGLVYRHLGATNDKKKDLKTISYFSNQWSEASTKLDQQVLVNLSLERDREAALEEVKTYSNSLIRIRADLSQVRTEAKSAADGAVAEVRKRDTRITELEGERDSMTRKMSDLTSSISDLETHIAETQRQLEDSEGDREFLLKELRRMQAEKTELERQFNDLALLREQVHKLRDELSISRRLEWIRRGLYGGLKGGELLRRGFASATTPQPSYNLDVEIKRDGGANILSTTNAPAASETSLNR
jgi:septal ring factor EnvC (AmiA/AmiB activator)